MASHKRFVIRITHDRLLKLFDWYVLKEIVPLVSRFAKGARRSECLIVQGSHELPESAPLSISIECHPFCLSMDRRFLIEKGSQKRWEKARKVG